ncbi:CHAT domain-containing protein [Streptomyces sp. NPDC057748]|uniref:CHAT domain-containing protein n=1 Tax=unclassified Streptomyces TaxID=2593676 RepID=UPI0036CC0127
MEIGPPLGDLYLLAARVADRSVSEEAALASATEGDLLDVQMEALKDCTMVAVDLVEDNPDHAYYFCRLILALTEAKYGRDRDSPWWYAADMFVEITRRSLHARPRGDRLRQALRAADLQIELLEQRIARLTWRGGLLSKRRRAVIGAERAELVETRLGAGWLLAGPYCAQLDPDDFDCSVAQWGAPFRLRGEVYSMFTTEGEVVTAETPGILRKLDPGRAIPEPRWALTAALGLLNAALRDASPSTRGRCQLLRIQVLSLLAWLDPKRAREHWRAATEAAEEVGRTVAPADGLDEFYRSVAPVARKVGLQEPASLKMLLPVPVSNLHRKVPGPLLVELLANVAAFVEDLDDLQEIWTEVHAVLAEREVLPIAPRVWMNLAHKLPGNRMRCIPEPIGVAELIASVEEICTRVDAPSGERAATLVHAALHVRAEDVAEAVELLDKIHEVDQAFRARYAWVLDYLLLAYRKRYAAQLEEAGEYCGALLEYATAAEDVVRYAARHRSPGLATDLANRALAVAKRAGNDEQLVRVVLLLKAVAPVVTSLLGPEDERVGFVSGVGQELARLVIRAGSPPLVAEHHLLFKGFDFRQLVQNAGPRPLTPAVKFLNELIAVQEKRDGPYVPDRMGFLDDGVGIPGGTSGLFFVNSLEISPGNDAEASCGNLRRVADQAISNEAIHRAFRWEDAKIVKPPPFEMVDHWASGLGEETVFISLYLAEHDQKDADGAFSIGTSLVSCHVTTRDLTSNVTRLGFPGSLFRFDSLERNAAYMWHFAAFPVAEVREETNVGPGGSPVTLRGAAVLEQYFRLSGVAAGQLHEWRAEGKRHLCFWPHGPLHYLPFHLLHVDGRPLADDWIVTTVGGSAQFLSRTIGKRRRHRLLIAGSSAGGARYGLPKQPQIAQHVRNLADQVPGARLLKAGATTPRAVMQALKNVDYLHIAAHGSHDVEAPWYQCLYLDPGADDDGRLFAHQILGLDLRGVELVTLSACESALGRYDLNDNLRGLPAAFLTAGASTVIGVLWPVSAPVATLFFEELYSCLLTGGTKRDAFHSAQRATRNAHPEYLHWGAFTLIGDWR